MDLRGGDDHGVAGIEPLTDCGDLDQPLGLGVVLRARHAAPPVTRWPDSATGGPQVCEGCSRVASSMLPSS